MEPGRQDVLEEAAVELVAGHGFGALASGCPVVVSEGYGVVAEVEDAAVGDGDA